jgi:sodium transport system permease protein
MTKSLPRWSNLLVIFVREVRDQVRDRRTLFMIFVLPILLYPMLGFGVSQFTAAIEQKPRIVVVVGAEFLENAPPLLNPTQNGFHPAYFDSPAEAEKMPVVAQSASGPWAEPRRRELAIRSGEASAVMILSHDLKDQLLREKEIDIPIKYNSVDETSQITYLRLKEVISRWRKGIVVARLKRDQKTESYIEPIQVKAEDVATASEVGGNTWSRLFPFLLVLMSLTGAFYPAIDLCAGEKER